MHSFIVDLRHSFRILARRPTFTVVALITLALGIGANTAVFSALHAVLLASMPYPESDRLVMGRRTQDGRVGYWVSMQDYYDYREQSTSFASLATTSGGSFRVAATGTATPERINAFICSFDLFHTLGVSPIQGRLFTADEGKPAPPQDPKKPPTFMVPPVTIISHAYWQRRFGGSPEAVGTTLTLMGQPTTVVGIMPEGFRFLDDTDVWLPMRLGQNDARRFHNWLLVGRLKSGVTIAQAQGEINTISERLAQLYPDSNKGKGLNLANLHDSLIENLRPQVLLIMAAVALMLLIACGNVANLLLARGVTRRSEMAMRVSLGATRWRLVRQLVTESLTLALLGGGLGLAVAALLQRVLPGLLGIEGNFLSISSLRLDLRVLVFALAVSLFTGIAVGLVPALRSTKVELFEELKGTTRTVTSHGGARLRMALVASQVTLSLVLLIGSALLIRSFAKLVRVNLGFDPDNVLTAQIALPPTAYPTDEARIQFFSGLLADIRAIPGVTAAGMINRMPIQSPGGDIYVWTPDKPPKERGLGQTAYTRITLPGYLDTMRMPLIAGRGIQDTDRIGSPPVLVINQTMAQTLFVKENPVGRQVVVDMGQEQPVTFEVIGVVADARVGSLSADPYPTMYHSYYQFPRATLSVVIRTAVAGQEITRSLREIVWKRDKSIPIEDVATMKGLIRRSTVLQQTLAGTVSAFATLALLLAAIGLFGVLAYQVNQRQHEIGIRMALGASRGHILATILKQGMTVTGVGLLAGVIAGLALTRLMRNLLFAVAATDPWSFFGASLCLVVVALVSCLIPALRALTIQPVKALRHE